MLTNYSASRNLTSEACPKCHARGTLHPHGHYYRHLKLDESHKMGPVKVQRVRCSCCKSTHAVLPEGVVPYEAFGTKILFAICLAKLQGMKIACICERFELSVRTLYRILDKLKTILCMLEVLQPGNGYGLLVQGTQSYEVVSAFLTRFARMPFQNVTINRSYSIKSISP